jgi:HAD superfamily hydrolase (TIGR01549 family)
MTIPARSAVRGLLFDLDGVLINSERAWFRVLERARQERGYDAIDYQGFRRSFGQGVEADRRDFFPRQSVTEVIADYERLFPAELAAVELMDGALAVLAVLRARGLQLAVVTNTPRALAAQILERTGIIAYLSAFAASGEAPEKPSPDLIHLALDRLGLKPTEVAYVGDSHSDLVACRAARVRMLGLGIQGDESLDTLPQVLTYLGLD